ncbi:MAG: TonB family protein [Candidatus Binatia bacterium]
MQSAAGGEEKLSRWLLFSFVVHGGLIVSLFLMPHLPSRTAPPAPVYTVDLVGGERIGANRGTELKPAPAPKEKSSKTIPEPPVPVAEAKPVPEIKKEPKKEKVEKPEKAEKVKASEKPVPAEERVPLKESPKKAAAPKEPAKETQSESKADEASLDRVRERLIKSALERVKSRAESMQKQPPGGDVISSGTGQGEGAATLGQGGRGGGVVKGIEFISYRNKVFSIIQDNWAWPGHRSDLKVTVRFGIKDTGEIIGVKVVQPSGDASYDESVLRAVKKSNPLPPPPESYRTDFSDVELNFLPPNSGK